MHPAENTMPLPISTVGGHDDTTNNDAATPHSDRDGRAITPPSPSLSYAGDHEKPKPLAGNTIHDDPVGSVSSGSGGGDSASGGTGGGGTGTNGRAACSNADDDSAPGVSPSNSGGDTTDSGTGGGGGASNGPPIKARPGPGGGNGVDEAAAIAAPGVEMCDGGGDVSLPTPSHSTSTIIGDCADSDTGGGMPGTNAPPTKRLAGHHGGSAGDTGRDLDSTAPLSRISEIPARVLREGNVDLSAADQARGNSARDGDDPATKPPAGGNGGGSPAGGEGQTDGKPPTGGKPATNAANHPAEGEESGSHVGGIEDLAAISGDDDDVAPPPSLSSDAADEDESAYGPFARKLPDGDDSAGGVSGGSGGGGSAGGGTGGGGAGTNGHLEGSYGDEVLASTAAASIAWVLTALHVALLQGVALRATRMALETDARPTALCG